MTVIKTWVIASHLTDKKLKERFPHVFDKAQRNEDRKNVFSKIKNVAQVYKHKAKKLRERIKAEDVVDSGENL